MMTEISKESIQRTSRAAFWITNTEYAKTNKDFKLACSRAKIEPTSRQASKYRRKQGKAYLEGRA
jgi:hypothetical protein